MNSTYRVIFVLLVLILGGCSRIETFFKAGPAPASGFIKNPENMHEMRDHAPFHSLWFKDRKQFDLTRSKFKKIYFAPVNTDFVRSKGWWDSLNTADKKQYKQDLKELAEYADSAFPKAFQRDPRKIQEVTQLPDKESIIYEIAITELISTKAHINAVGSVVGFVVPGGGLIKTGAKGSVAIEVKVIDGETEETIITWADREQDQSSLFSLSDFSWYSHARTSFDTWAEQLVKLHNSTTADLVEDSSAFTLNPL